jgi:15-cis-phytoene synthase
MSAAGPGGAATRALARLYSPPGEQPLLSALCALEAEIAGSLKPGTDHQVAHARLEWWREECLRTLRGTAAHPLTRALLESFAGRDAAPLAGLGGLVDTAVWDLASATFETRRELTAYCERWADAMIGPLIGHALPDGYAERRSLGAALREGELLGALARDARAGRLRLPLDELGAAGVDPASLARPPWPAALVVLLRTRHADLRARLAAAVRALPQQPPLRGLLVWTALASADSRRTEQRLPQVPLKSDDHGLLGGWRAWRAARRADAGRFTLD